MSSSKRTTSQSDLRRRCAELRATEYPWTEQTTYLNNASMGPVPKRTLGLLEKLNAEKAEPHTIDVEAMFGGLAKTRARVARLINAAVEEIGLTTSTTLGINVAAQALPLNSGDVVLVSDREFPANVYPWIQLQSRGVVVEIVPTTSEGWPDEDRLLDRVTDPSVRALTISLVQFSNGYRADLARLGDACRSNDCFLVVDGIQAVGQVAIDVKETPVDLLACGGQKWLLSPFGTGFIYVRKDLVEQLVPTFVGWMAFEGTDDFSRLTDYDNVLLSDARRFEIITLPFQDLIAMGESIELRLGIGVDSVEGWLREVREPLADACRGGRINVISPLDDTHSSSIVCVSPQRLDRCLVKLKQESSVVALREGALRLSPHCYNTPDEMEKAVNIISDFS